MKQVFLIGLLASVLFSCNESSTTDETANDLQVNVDSLIKDEVVELETESSSHQFTALAEDNPTKTHFESLLNTYYEEFEELPFGEVDFESSELVYGYTLFRTVETKTEVRFFFADKQSDLITFAQANFQEGYYGVNGGGLFLVAGDDDQSLNDVLSWFAGQE